MIFNIISNTTHMDLFVSKEMCAVTGPISGNLLANKQTKSAYALPPSSML